MELRRGRGCLIISGTHEAMDGYYSNNLAHEVTLISRQTPLRVGAQRGHAACHINANLCECLCVCVSRIESGGEKEEKGDPRRGFKKLPQATLSHSQALAKPNALWEFLSPSSSL